MKNYQPNRVTQQKWIRQTLIEDGHRSSVVIITKSSNKGNNYRERGAKKT